MERERERERERTPVTKIYASLARWMTFDLTSLSFNSISVISGRLESNYEISHAMVPRLRLKFMPPVEIQPGTARLGALDYSVILHYKTMFPLLKQSQIYKGKTNIRTELNKIYLGKLGSFLDMERLCLVNK